jgi:hypothetical protein
METLAVILSYASGFALMRYHENPAELIATSVAIDLGLGPLTTVIAIRRGRSLLLWVALGFAFGLWALVAILVICHSRSGPERGPDTDFPPTSRAA